MFSTDFRRRYFGLYPAIKNPKLIMTLLVKNEADILEQNLLFHKAQGVDGFIVTDNISTDGTLEIIKKYQAKGWILEFISEKNQSHLQPRWVHRMIGIARAKYSAAWIINSDADEFWSAANGNLKAELSTINSNKIFVPVYNMRDRNTENFLDNTECIVSAFPVKAKEKLVEAEKLSRHSQFIVCVKVLHRAQDYLQIHEGNHNADMVIESRRKIAKNICIYHYNFRGLEHFRNKVINGGKAMENRAQATDKKINKHWRYFYEGYKNNTLDLAIEYKKTTGEFCLPEIQKHKLLQTDKTVQKFFANR